MFLTLGVHEKFVVHLTLKPGVLSTDGPSGFAVKLSGFACCFCWKFWAKQQNVCAYMDDGQCEIKSTLAF